MLESLRDLPSWKSVLKATFLGGQIPFLSDTSPAYAPRLGTLQSCPNPVLSCKSAGAVSDTCCINHPGQCGSHDLFDPAFSHDIGGQFALTQFWNSGKTYLDCLKNRASDHIKILTPDRRDILVPTTPGQSMDSGLTIAMGILIQSAIVAEAATAHQEITNALMSAIKSTRVSPTFCRSSVRLIY
jgi:hypothetical protein